jgi:deoxyribonuclease V
MILAVDVGYGNVGAKAAGVIFEAWESEEVVAEYTLHIDKVAEYFPGKFYQRELPCLTALIEQITYPITCIVVDGYVYLGSEKRPGLGKHLWEKLNGAIAVIGVAKSSFKDTPNNTELIRGMGKKPLYITAEGIHLEVAKKNIFQMNGNQRIPTLLKYVDSLSRPCHGNMSSCRAQSSQWAQSLPKASLADFIHQRRGVQ